jgi:hypothetical protein
MPSIYRRGEEPVKSISAIFPMLSILVITALLMAACGGAPQQPAVTEVAQGEHREDDTVEEEHEDEHTEEPEGGAEDEHVDEAAHDNEDTHTEEAGHEDEHTAGAAHDVPEEASEVPNPIEADAASIEAGSVIFAASCATCHGENGEGDGPAAEGLEKKPADLHESHVQELPDGALFYIVTHGIPDTPMVAWENVLDEEERWHVVNFLRTFGE